MLGMEKHARPHGDRQLKTLNKGLTTAVLAERDAGVPCAREAQASVKSVVSRLAGAALVRLARDRRRHGKKAKPNRCFHQFR